VATSPLNGHPSDAQVARNAVSVLTSLSGLALGRRGRRRGDQGATATEYALVAGLIAVVIVVSVTLFGQNVSGLFNVPASAF
jgi:pilus assembly protein Flp/PilA